MNSLSRPFRKLRWKLTFSYTLITVLVALLTELALFGALLFFITRSPVFPAAIEQQAEQIANQALPFLLCAEENPRGLEAWLLGIYPPRSRGSAVFEYQVGPMEDSDGITYVTADGDYVVILGPDRQVLGDNSPQAAFNQGTEFQDEFNPEESRKLIELAYDGDIGSISLPDHTILASAPILDFDNTVQGAVYLRITSLSPVFSPTLILEGLKLIGVSLLIFTVGAGVIGTLFGFFTARGLARRLQTVSQASDSWSQGDFSIYVKDPSGDELGEMSRRLNRMAEQLENLMEARQELATVEERNRLARDLHDSVKQQVFATVMQIGAAKALLKSKPEAAQERLREAEHLAREAQRELTGLIRELRPAALEGKGLAQALREYAGSWSDQTGIQADLRLQGEHALPLALEQALFRVFQEGLANVARHSQAAHVMITLVWRSDDVLLTIEDDGLGFDPESIERKGIGLQSMAERARAHGGEFTVESTPGKGASVRVRCPIKTGD